MDVNRLTKLFPRNTKFRRGAALTILICLLGLRSVSQTLPVGILENAEDAYRRQQLLGKDSSARSYMIRPLNISDLTPLMLDSNNSSRSIMNFGKVIYSNDRLKSVISVLPIVLHQQYTTHHPYGINDGAMISARGYESLLSLGVFAKIGPLSIQLRPEYVFAENKTFREWSSIAPNSGAEVTSAFDFYSFRYIDEPERFGSGQYSKILWGQSSIRLTFDPVSLGLSSENLWWGPGIRNSLLMTNNAAGFKHVTLNTSRPVKTPIGSFEAQIVGGRLEPSGIPNPTNSIGAVRKSTKWTYFSGVVFSYQPKWLPNLFLGFDRSFIVNEADLGNKLSDYLPFLTPLEKRSFDDDNGGKNLEDLAARDQYVSVFARWVLPETHAEVYFQFGRNDHPYDLRDLLVEPEHSRAYVVGLKKLVPLRRPDEYLQVGIEVSKLEGTQTGTIRPQPTWYQHYQVRNGYTHSGQVIGAGIGMGGNLQTLDISWVKGLKRIGLQFEKLEQNKDLYKITKSDIDLPWTDLSMTGKFDWNFSRFLFSSQFSYIRSLNYQYTLKQDKGLWDWDQQDVNNFQLKVGLMYRW